MGYHYHIVGLSPLQIGLFCVNCSPNLHNLFVIYNSFFLLYSETWRTKWKTPTQCTQTFLKSWAHRLVIAIVEFDDGIAQLNFSMAFFVIQKLERNSTKMPYKNWFRVMNTFTLDILFYVQIILFFKVHIFWEGHKILRNLHLTFDCHYIGQK